MIRGEIFNSATIEGMLAAPGEKWHRDPPDVIPLYLADPDFPVASAIKRALLNAVHDEDLFYNYDDETREAMAAKIVRRNGLEATADDIMITQGVIPGMWLAIRYACRAGDEVIVNDPMYFPFFEAIETTETKPIHWPLEMEEGYRFDVERLKDAVTERTKLIFVCNPHNPCGRVMTKEELKGIADVAIDKGITVMVDELWEDILFDGRKHIARAAAPVMLDDTLEWWKTDMMTHLHKIRSLCEKRFEETSGVTCPKLEGTYLMYPKFDYGMTSEELERHLFEKARLRFSAGTDFGPQGEGHLRMCIATSEAIINEVFDRMQKALKKLK